MNGIRFISALIAFVFSVSAAQAQSDQQINFGNLPNKTYGDIPFDLIATATSSLPVQFTSSNSAVATIDGRTVTIVGAGETIITATQPGDSNFNPAQSISQSLQVQKADQTITFTGLPVKTFGEGVFLLSASSTSGLSISYTSSNPAVASIVGNAIFINGAGECVITASQEGNANYNGAPPVNRTLTVNRAPQFISFSSLPNKTYGDMPFDLSATATSGQVVSYTSNSTLISIVGNQVTILGAGSVEITASQSGNGNFLPAEDVVQQLIINKAAQTITFDPIQPKTYGDPPFLLTASASSELTITFLSQYDSLLTIEGTMATIVGAGALKVYAVQEGNENYLPKTVEQTLIINKAPQTIMFEALAPKKFGDKPFTIFATASSGLPVSFTSNRKTVAKVSGNTITIAGAGTAPIVAIQAGNANYLPAPQITQSLLVSALGNSYPLMGIARTGGNGRGTIFNVNTDGSSFTLQKNFSPNAYNGPQSGLIRGSDGKLYGMIMSGGTPSNGVVFSIQPDGSGYQVLHNFSFTDGQRPFGNLLEASNGYLYGMTYDGGIDNTGVLFRIKKDGSEFSILYQFPNAGTDGYHPLGGLLEATNGDLYGMTAEGGLESYGVIFKIKKDGSGYTKLIDLDGITKGGFPRGNLVQGPDNFLYGMTVRGGSSNNGVVFKVNTDGSGYSNIVEFDGANKGSTPGASLIFGDDGKLYGMAQSGGSHNKGTIFSVNSDGTQFNKLFDFDGLNSGALASGSLVQSSTDGYLYGLTNQGGASDLGIAFKIKKDGTGFTKLLDFTGTNGASPVFGPLLEVDNGKFVGMTSRGGPSNSGILFSVTSGGTFGLVKDFPQPEGTPEIISTSNGVNYFGVASSGGPLGNGAIFKTASDGSGYEKIHDLNGNFLFVYNLVHTSDNKLWGAGREGVLTMTNVLFNLNDDGSGFQRVQFNEASGLAVGYLIEGPDKFLFGWGYVDGSPHGVIFKFKTDGTNFVKLADIPGGALGSRPTENLVLTADGNLFGLTQEGGLNNWGTVFKYNLVDNQFSSIFSLQTEITGAYPKKLILLNDGSLCLATAVGGLHDSGTLISISQDGNDYNKIYDFNTGIASGPTDIIHTVDGYLVGLAEYGGASNNGIIFELLTDGSNFKKIYEFNGLNGASPEQVYFRKAEQIISFTLAAKQYNDPDFVLNATNSSGLPLTFTSSNTSIASIYNNNMVKIHGVGEVVITASADGNVNFLPSQTARTLVINKDDQDIAFDPIQDIVIGSNAFNIFATTTSGLPVEFSSISDHISLTGNLVTLVSPGSVQIQASQAGNAYYNAAPIQHQTFCIYPSKPTLIATDITFETAVLTSSQPKGNQWYRNGELLLDEVSSSILISENGLYTVITTIDGCSSEPSEPYTMIITGVDNSEDINEPMLHPNPSTTKINLNLSPFAQDVPVDIQIFDNTGRLIQHLILKNHPDIELNIQSMNTGLYILKATSNGNVILLRFAKQ